MDSAKIKFVIRLMFWSNVLLVGGYSFFFTYIHLWLFQEYLSIRLIGMVDMLSTIIGIAVYWALSQEKYLEFIEHRLPFFIVFSSVLEITCYGFYLLYPVVGYCIGAGLMTASRAISFQGFQTIINRRIVDNEEHKYRTVYQGKKSQSTEVGVLVSASSLLLIGNLPTTVCICMLVIVAVLSVILDLWLYRELMKLKVLNVVK